MLGLLSTIVNAAKAAFGKLLGKPQMQKAAQIAKIVGEVLRFALPAAELVAKFTPNRTDDEIIALLKELALPVPEDYTTGRPFTEMEKKGLLIQAAREALAGNLEAAIVDAGGAGLKLAGQVVTSKTQVPGSILDQAAQSVYTMFLSPSAAQFVEGK